MYDCIRKLGYATPLGTDEISCYFSKGTGIVNSSLRLFSYFLQNKVVLCNFPFPSSV